MIASLQHVIAPAVAALGDLRGATGAAPCAPRSQRQAPQRLLAAAVLRVLHRPLTPVATGLAGPGLSPAGHWKGDGRGYCMNVQYLATVQSMPLEDVAYPTCPRSHAVAPSAFPARVSSRRNVRSSSCTDSQVRAGRAERSHSMKRRSNRPRAASWSVDIAHSATKRCFHDNAQRAGVSASVYAVISAGVWM